MLVLNKSEERKDSQTVLRKKEQGEKEDIGDSKNQRTERGEEWPTTIEEKGMMNAINMKEEFEETICHPMIEVRFLQFYQMLVRTRSEELRRKILRS